jgi:electron transport complex protein RnfG
MYKKILFAFLLFCSIANAQHRERQAPVLHEVSNQQIVVGVYPEAVKVEKVNEYWFKILDKAGKTVGFAMSSSDFCKNVKGYRDTTPVMIVTDKKFIIKRVALQSNYESLSYVENLERNGFFKSWVGKNVKKAKAAQVDGTTGATYTANAVTKNVMFLLENGSKKMPKI